MEIFRDHQESLDKKLNPPQDTLEVPYCTQADELLMTNTVDEITTFTVSDVKRVFCGLQGYSEDNIEYF